MTPVIKVNNRNKNLDFYRENLGFKIWHEENAFADLGAKSSREAKLILEESPSTRSRKVKGPKKLKKIVIRVAEPLEIEALLARGAVFDRLFRGPRGWAFESSSPEGDVFLLHSERDLADLTESEEHPDFEMPLDDFTGLTDLSLEKILIHTSDLEASKAFYGKLFRNYSLLEFVSVEGADLQVDNDQTWDLVGLELRPSEPLSLRGIQADLALLGITSFVNKRATFLTMKDPSGLDITFRP